MTVFWFEAGGRVVSSRDDAAARLHFFLVYFHDAYDSDIRVLQRLLDVCELRVGNLQDKIRFRGHESASSLSVVCDECVQYIPTAFSNEVNYHKPITQVNVENRTFDK
jgi:hypothetical protein